VTDGPLDEIVDVSLRARGPGQRVTEDPIVVAARFLQSQITWLSHAADGTQPWAPGAFREISDCAGRMRALVNGPSERKYLGPCGAELATEVEPGITRIDLCDGDVYGIRGASRARCRVCGAEVASEDRAAWLDAEVRSRAFRAAEIADAYGVNVNTIRTWHTRGLLTAHGEDRDGRPLFNVGDVLDMFRDLAVRRAEGQAKRARRLEQATVEGDAA
jgi:hypothetical protein